MNVFQHIRSHLFEQIDILSNEGDCNKEPDLSSIRVEAPRDSSHGDLTTNAAMVLAKQAKTNPIDLARILSERLALLDDIKLSEVAGPGFVNLRLTSEYWRSQLSTLLLAGSSYGESTLGKGLSINVEYVSANPTGPLHIGHGRGAVVGDVIANMLEKMGYGVTREYYINDSGVQIEALARSVFVRYQQAMGIEVSVLPDGFYPGEYLIPVGQQLARSEGDRWLLAPDIDWLDQFAAAGCKAMMTLIKNDLNDLGIRHNIFFSEKDVHQHGKTEETLNDLRLRDLIYEGVLDPPKGMKLDDWEPRPQTLFRATKFGDDVDRPLKKSNGDWTYFAADIAYHRDKYERGFSKMIDVWGADHGGYIKRMVAAVDAISNGQANLDVKICQLVNVLKDGVAVKMSKRAGDFVTLREVIDQVGKDVVRYIMLTRRNDAPLDFDFAAVTEQSRDNPVFYVQYAHARGCSLLRRAIEIMPNTTFNTHALSSSELDRLVEPEEIELIKILSFWPNVLESAALAKEPHRLTYYLHEVASAFHGIWSRGDKHASLRFIIANEPELSLARLALVKGVLTVISAGLSIIGVKPVEELK